VNSSCLLACLQMMIAICQSLLPSLELVWFFWTGPIVNL
jgi:hypothetical protein